MGREIRRVPKNWQHPINEECRHWGVDPHRGLPCYKPMHDQDYKSAATEWMANYQRFQDATPEERAKEFSKYCEYYWEYDSPPDEELYRPVFDGPADCYQIYETVSEGTPVSPVFETQEEMIEWLVSEGHSRKSAEAFVKDGWAPSLVVFRSGGDVEILTGVDAADKWKEE